MKEKEGRTPLTADQGPLFRPGQARAADRGSSRRSTSSTSGPDATRAIAFARRPRHRGLRDRHVLESRKRPTPVSIAVATLPTPKRRFGIDWSQPIFVGLVDGPRRSRRPAAVLARLLQRSSARRASCTLANFAALVTDPTLRRPYLTAFAMALSVGLLSCVIATPLAWLVARTDLPGAGWCASS